MIGATGQLLLNQAIGAVANQRAQESQARQQQQLAAQNQVVGTTKPKISKPKASTSSSKPAKASTNGITPYATAEDDMGYANQVQQSGQQLADIGNTYSTAAANAFRSGQQAVQTGEQGIHAANASAADRGVFNSGVRQQGVVAAGTQEAQGVNNAGGDLALAGLQAIAGRNQVSQSNTAYMQALAAKMAQNGAALPVSPGSQNVPGATTLRKPTGSAGKGK